ncbi:TPA: Ig-like domain-containing protein [Vibrio parahaemolyticus]
MSRITQRLLGLVALFSLLLSGCNNEDKLLGPDTINPLLPNQAMSLIVTPKTASVPVGFTQKLRAEATLTDGQVMDVTEHRAIEWSSSDTSVATISDDGVVTAKGVGSTTITATGTNADESVVTDTAALTVTEAGVVRLEVLPADASVAVGLEQAFTAQVVLTDNTVRPVTEYATWSTSNPTTALVSDEEGSKGIAQGRAVSGDSPAEITASLTVNGETYTDTATLNVLDATVTALQVASPAASIAKGFGQTFTATAILSNNLTQDVTSAIRWTSSDSALVTISNDAGTEGYATAVEVTETPVTITATGLFNGQTLTQTAQMSVTSAVVTELQVTPTTEVTPIGLEKGFIARAFFSDNTSLEVTDHSAISWTSDNDAIAIVSAAGVSTGVGAGEAHITAGGRANGTDFEASATLTVTDAIVSRLDIAPVTASLPVGLTQALEATVTLSDGKTTQNITDNAAVTWTSSDPTVATVSTGLDSGNGVVTGVSAGSAIITAQGTANGTDFSAQMSVTVTSAIITSLQIEPTTDSVPVGLSTAFTATALLSDNSTLDVTDEMELSWSSNNTATATITSANTTGGNGVATGKAVGSVTITAAGLTPEGSTVENTATLEVTDSIITELTVTPTLVNLAEGLTQQFTATARYSDGVITEDVTTQPAISWTVESETGAATISDTGLVTGEISGGTAIIKASGTTPEGATLTGQATVTVIDAMVSDLQVTPATQSTPAGTSVQFTATALMSNGSSPTVTDHPDLHWTSSDPTVASITTDLASGNGYVTTLKAGSVTITASGNANGTDFESTATLTVTAAIPVSIAVSPTSVSVAKGITQQFTSEVTYSDNSTVDMTTATTWASSDTEVVTINSNGLASGVGEGIADITASLVNHGVVVPYDTATLTVTAAEVVSLSVTPASASIPAGTTQQLTATATMTDSSTPEVTTQAVWSSGDTSIATIGSATGLATGESAGGPVTLTATYAGQTGTSPLTVTAARLESIAVTPNPAEVEASATTTLTATGTYTDGTTPDITMLVGWTGQDTTIATVESGTVTGVAEGSTSTTASLDDGYGATISSEAVTINVTPEPFVLPICGGGVDDADPTNATGTCLKVATDNDGNWFTSTPSVAVMDLLGYEIDDSSDNTGDTYTTTYTELGLYGPDGGEFARFTQEGIDATNPADGGDGTNGQFYRWCQKLNALEFGGRTTWQRPTKPELSAFYQKYVDEGAEKGLWDARGWPTYTYYFSSTVSGSSYSSVRLYDGRVFSVSPGIGDYASCVSENP